MHKNLDIPFVGLKQGVHSFNFEIGKTFFDAFPFSIVEKGKISVDSPIGKSLLGKEIGESVEVDVPAGKLELEIKNIEI